MTLYFVKFDLVYLCLVHFRCNSIAFNRLKNYLKVTDFVEFFPEKMQNDSTSVDSSIVSRSKGQSRNGRTKPDDSDKLQISENDHTT